MHPDLLWGYATRDDAAIFRLDRERALVQTMDFFTPMVDDPYAFGQIAAANALNDVYAMGGKPLTAMNIVCYPECGDLQVLGAILRGGIDKVHEAGAVLVGGHSVDDNEPKYGLSVTGMVNPEKYTTNSNLRSGDMVYLTKPLGTGIITTAIKADIAEPGHQQAAITTMSELNRLACEAMLEVEGRCCTDVTGFGLLGHLLEMAIGSNCLLEVSADNLELLPGAIEYARMGLIPAGTYNNRKYIGERVAADPLVDIALLDIMYTPETAGGLLIAVPESSAMALESALKQRRVVFSLAGKVTGSGVSGVRVRR